MNLQNSSNVRSHRVSTPHGSLGSLRSTHRSLHARQLALARVLEAEPEPLLPVFSILPLPLFSASLPASAMAELGEAPLLLALLSFSSSPTVHSNIAHVTTAGHAAPSSHFPGHRCRRSRPIAAATANGHCNTPGVCHQLSNGFELKHDMSSGNEGVKIKST